MGLGLKEGILRIAAYHNRRFNKLELPADFYAPSYIVVLAAYINHHQITEVNCTLPHEGYMRAIGMQMALWGKDSYEQERVNSGKFNISDLTSNHKNDDDVHLLEIIKKLGGR